MRNPFRKGICAVLLIGVLAFSIPLFGEASSETALLAEQREQRVLLHAKWDEQAEMALLAVFDSVGRFLGVSVSEQGAQSCEAEIMCGLESAAEAALFLLDANLKPIREAVRTKVSQYPQELVLSVNGSSLTVSWEDNPSVSALRELVQSELLEIPLSMYGGFEQVGTLGKSLPRDDVRITTNAGDIVLYSGNSIVLFYGSNTWAYTRLGKIQGLSQEELTALLGGGNVTVTLEMR
ncbi:MAG: hypothetical protein IJT94_18720 [Oscillibacter sp.]|nr:hypothetical protein [Oscillibacter sp.]